MENPLADAVGESAGRQDTAKFQARGGGVHQAAATNAARGLAAENLAARPPGVDDDAMDGTGRRTHAHADATGFEGGAGGR
jgi:hypothetical protein